MTLLSEVRVDSADFAAWVRPHLPVMGRVAARLAPDADRDDVVQDALTRAWRKQGQYDESRGSASAWLCAIVAGEARRARGRRRPLDVTVTDASYDVVPDLDLERAVATLPKRQRTCEPPTERTYFSFHLPDGDVMIAEAPTEPEESDGGALRLCDLLAHPFAHRR